MSAADPLGGPAQLVLTASIARRYYLDGRSKIEIGEEFRLSRFKVARLLELARSSGLVRIEIGQPGTLDVALSSRLQDAYGLRHSLVVETPDEPLPELRQHLGAAAADLLTEIATPDDVLGLAWGRSVAAMAAQLRRLPPIPIVQLIGAFIRTDGDDSSIDLVREVARTSGGAAHFFHSPGIVADAPTARSLRLQPDVARAMDRVGSVTRAVVGIGRWAPTESTIYDGASQREQRALDRQGVCAEVAGVFLTGDGTTLHTALNERMIGVSAEQLASVDEVIGIPYGRTKAPAVRAALRAGLVNALVTHSSMAHALLEEA